MWLPIRYRDFYDLPRMFVVEYRSQVFLFDCPFDEAADEYNAEFEVYRLAAYPDEETWGRPEEQCRMHWECSR